MVLQSRVLVAALTSMPLLVVALPAFGDLTFFSDRAAFDAATIDQSVVDFEGIAADDGYVYLPSPPGITLQNVSFTIDQTISDGNMFVIGKDRYFPATSTLSPQATSTGIDSVKATLPGSFTAVGLNFGTINWGVLSTYTFTLSTEDTFTRLNVGGPTMDFVGLLSTTPVSHITVAKPGGYALNIDNFIYANAFPGSSILPGDLNEDSHVNSQDLDIVRRWWGKEVGPCAFDHGDANCDGMVNSADLDVVRANWEKTAAVAIPEPACTALVACAAIALLVRRRDRNYREMIYLLIKPVRVRLEASVKHGWTSQVVCVVCVRDAWEILNLKRIHSRKEFPMKSRIWTIVLSALPAVWCCRVALLEGKAAAEEHPRPVEAVAQMRRPGAFDKTKQFIEKAVVTRGGVTFRRAGVSETCRYESAAFEGDTLEVCAVYKAYARGCGAPQGREVRLIRGERTSAHTIFLSLSDFDARRVSVTRLPKGAGFAVRINSDPGKKKVFAKSVITRRRRDYFPVSGKASAPIEDKQENTTSYRMLELAFPDKETAESIAHAFRQAIHFTKDGARPMGLAGG